MGKLKQYLKEVLEISEKDLNEIHTDSYIANKIRNTLKFKAWLALKYLKESRSLKQIPSDNQKR